MWDEEASRLALLELWATGSLRRRRSQGESWDELARLPWTRRSSRQGELLLHEAHRGDLETLLDRCFVGWREVLGDLRERGLSTDLSGWRRLRELARRAELPERLPERLNRRTLSATLGAHSKVTLGERLSQALEPLEVTTDGLIRIRPNQGLCVARGPGDERWSAEELTRLLGELTLTERAIRGSTRFDGILPRAILLAENVGFFVDVRAPAGWMVAHVPGWNTRIVRMVFELLPRIPVVHFGDLDPNGVRIVAHLRLVRPDLIWAVPPFWEEHVPLRAQRGSWPSELDLTDAPPLVRRLAAREQWLEQEVLALDPRLPGYLEGLLARSRER